MAEPLPWTPRRRSAREIRTAIDPPATDRDPNVVLDEVTVERLLVQDFRPVVDSLEWELSASCWTTEASDPFVTDDVPYVVNNSGWAAASAATVLFANCRESGELDETIRVLELGAGLGLFARQFLDTFRELCIEHGQDYYERIVYHVTDFSEKTVARWRDDEIFVDHGDHVVLARCDAMTPAVLTDLEGRSSRLSRLQAVFANYLLDSLPVAVVRQHNGAHEQLCVRTHLGAHNDDEVGRQAGLTYQQIVELARSDRVEDRARLLPALSYFEFEAAFRPDGAASLPYLQEAIAAGAGRRYMVLSYGAIRCLDACLALLHPQGFTMGSDFGPTSPEVVDEVAYVGRFGSTVAVSVNFPLLEHHLATRRVRTLKPEGDADRSIHTRLFTVAAGSETAAAFMEQYGTDAPVEADRLASDAIEHINAGRFDDALECYQTALRHCPNDWHLLGQAAQFLTQQLLRHRAALELGQAALALNPWYSAFLWNTVGNSLFCLGEHDQAHDAYLRAQAIDPDDPQTNLNLAYTFAQSRNYREALNAVARGLAEDPDGRFTSALLTKQRQIVDALASRQSAEQQRLDQRHKVFNTVR